jgi:oligosaccharide repeat unit polymerase
MIYHLAFIILLFALTVFNYRLGRKNVLYPPFLFSVIWLVILSLYFMLYLVPLIEMSTLRVATLFAVMSGVIAFSAGGIIVGRQKYLCPLTDAQPDKSIYRKVLFFICVILLPIFYLEIRKLSGAGGLDGFLASARAAIVEELTNGESPYGGPLTTIAPLFAIFVAFIFVIEARSFRKERLWLWASTIAAMIFCILTTGRAGFLKLLVGLAGIYLIKSGRYSAKQAWKFIRWPLLGFALLFTVMIPITKDVSSGAADLTEAITQFSVGYAVLPLAGFDYVLQHPDEYRYNPNHTFREILPGLARLAGLNYTPSLPSGDFLEVPLFTNVYTAFEPYYVDFGFVGMLIAMFILGAGQTWLFWRALTGAPFYIFLYAISLYPLCMVAFDDTYTLFLHYFAEFVFALVYFRFLRRIPIPIRSKTFALLRTGTNPIADPGMQIQ